MSPNSAQHSRFLVRPIEKTMLLPLAALELDLAAGPRTAPLPARFRRARVPRPLGRPPVGIVHVSVRARHVWRDDVLNQLHRQSPDALPREAVRRALLATGLPAQLTARTLKLDPRAWRNRSQLSRCPAFS